MDFPLELKRQLPGCEVACAYVEARKAAHKVRCRPPHRGHRDERFARACDEPCKGRADHKFIYALGKIDAVGVTDDPRKVAELAMFAVSFEMPGEG